MAKSLRLSSAPADLRVELSTVHYERSKLADRANEVIAHSSLVGIHREGVSLLGSERLIYLLERVAEVKYASGP